MRCSCWLFMLLLAPLMRYVPLAALAAVLLVVAWNMSELGPAGQVRFASDFDRALQLAESIAAQGPPPTPGPPASVAQ
jgi:MFS superfamily sulfate permease-like transporter